MVCYNKMEFKILNYIFLSLSTNPPIFSNWESHKVDTSVFGLLIQKKNLNKKSWVITTCRNRVTNYENRLLSLVWTESRHHVKTPQIYCLDDFNPLSVDWTKELDDNSTSEQFSIWKRSLRMKKGFIKLHLSL